MSFQLLLEVMMHWLFSHQVYSKCWLLFQWKSVASIQYALYFCLVSTDAPLYNYFRFLNTNVRRTGILLPDSISTTILGMLFCISFPNCIEIGHPRLSNDVLSIFKMAAAQYYFRFRIGTWCPSLDKAKVYQQTKFRRDNSSWLRYRLTTFVLEK